MVDSAVYHINYVYYNQSFSSDLHVTLKHTRTDLSFCNLTMDTFK